MPCSILPRNMPTDSFDYRSEEYRKAMERTFKCFPYQRIALGITPEDHYNWDGDDLVDFIKAMSYSFDPNFYDKDVKAFGCTGQLHAVICSHFYPVKEGPRLCVGHTLHFAPDDYENS